MRPFSSARGWTPTAPSPISVSGTVHSSVDLSGPHATLQLEDESGRVWHITMSPPRRASRSGLTEETIPVGAEVSIVGNRNSNPQSFEVKTVRVIYDGKNYDVYPNRIS